MPHETVIVPPHRMPYHDAELDCYRVPLTKGYTALVDAVDVPRVAEHLWHANVMGSEAFASGDINGRNLRLARFILLGVAGSADRRANHANDDWLDCRRSNLRVATPQDSARRCRVSKDGRSSIYRGVTLEKTGKWRARISLDGKLKNLNAHSHEIDAADAYDRAAAFYYGAFARLNFPHREAV